MPRFSLSWPTWPHQWHSTYRCQSFFSVVSLTNAKDLFWVNPHQWHFTYQCQGFLWVDWGHYQWRQCSLAPWPDDLRTCKRLFQNTSQFLRSLAPCKHNQTIVVCQLAHIYYIYTVSVYEYANFGAVWMHLLPGIWFQWPKIQASAE